MENIRRWTIILIFVLSVGFVIGQQKGDTYASASGSKTAKLVYVHAGVNGFASEDSQGKMVGLLVDVMTEFEQFVSNKYGISVSSQYVEATNKDFSLYIDEVGKSSGGVFGLSNTSIKEERKEFLKYSPTFLNNISVLISHRNFPTLQNMDDIGTAFASKTGFGVPSTTNYDRMIKVKEAKFPSMKITSVSSSREILQNISTNTNAFGFSDIHYYLEFIEQGMPVKRHPAGDQVGDEFGIIMPMDSDWNQVLSEFLSDFIKTAKYRELVISNLGKGALRMIAK